MLGQKPDTDQKDAVHVAIVAVKAGEPLSPGDHVSVKNNVALLGSEAIGIVDPFLSDALNEGDSFYLCLYPETVTGMRHEWNHPAFDDLASAKDEMKRLAGAFHISYHHIMEACEAFARGEDFCFWSDYGPDLMYSHRDKVAALFYKITGKTFDAEHASFRCAC